MKTKDFKIFDLIVLSALAIGIEFLGYFLVDKLESSIYLSFALVIGIIAQVRWGLIGMIVFVLSGVPLLFLKNGSFVSMFFYEIIANAFICIPFLVMKKRNRDELVSTPLKAFLLCLLCVVSISIGKGIVLGVVEQDISSVLKYFSSTLLIFVINILIFMMLVYNKSELIRDMDLLLESYSQEE